MNVIIGIPSAHHYWRNPHKTPDLYNQFLPFLCIPGGNVAMTTSYPLIAKYGAICESIPPVAPVTTAISRLGGCWYRRPLFHDHSPFSRLHCPRRGLAAGTSQRWRDRQIIPDRIELSGNWVFITPTCHPSRPTLTAVGPGV